MSDELVWRERLGDGGPAAWYSGSDSDRHGYMITEFSGEVYMITEFSGEVYGTRYSLTHRGSSGVTLLHNDLPSLEVAQQMAQDCHTSQQRAARWSQYMATHEPPVGNGEHHG